MPEPLDIAPIKARAEAATPGPWTARPVLLYWRLERLGKNINGRDDVAFCAHARQDVPALIAEVEHLRGALSRLREDLLRYGGHGMFCPHDAKSDRGPCDCGWPALKAELVQMKGGA